MLARSVVVFSTALATLGLALNAATAHPGRHERPAPARVTVEGLVFDWDAGATALTVDDPDVHGAARPARRLLRSAGEVRIDIGPKTRIVTEDDAGDRERVTAADLFAELDASAEDLEVEASGLLVTPAAGPRSGATPEITAKRVVVYLPAADAADPADDGSDLPDDGTDPAPPAEDGPGA